MRASIHVCLLLSRLFEAGPLARYGTRNQQQVDSLATCVADRVATVPWVYDLFAQFSPLEGKTVLELGCARGYLLDSLLDLESFRAIGVDRDPRALADGATKYGGRITFVQSSETAIPLPDASCDVIYTIDTMEHLSNPDAIFREVHRILRPGGLLLILFHPWLGPYAAHVGEIIPLPWPHVLFSMDTVMAAAAHRYDASDSIHAFHQVDPATGARRANPYLGDWRHYVNPDMTIRGFRRFLRRHPFQLLHERRIGFGGKGVALARLLRPLAQIPYLDEFFTSMVFCVCQRDGT